MLSKLDTIFKTQFRHAESTDTRQAIQHRDQDQHRRKDDEDNNNPNNELWHDDISVSVQSVKDILEQLLHKPAHDFSESAQNISAKTTETNTAEKGDATKDNNPQSDRAAKAAMAYQRTWETAHPEEQVYKPTKENLPEISLSGAESRMMNDLIANLETLLENKVTTLTLEKSDSFLHALQDAVNKALKDLS